MFYADPQTISIFFVMVTWRHVPATTWAQKEELIAAMISATMYTIAVMYI